MYQLVLYLEVPLYKEWQGKDMHIFVYHYLAENTGSLHSVEWFYRKLLIAIILVGFNVVEENLNILRA